MYLNLNQQFDFLLIFQEMIQQNKGGLTKF